MSTNLNDVKSPDDTMTLPLRKSCQSCNMAKLKCSGHRPQCARCRRRVTPCVYAPSKPVGRPPRRAQSRAIPQSPLYPSHAAVALRGLKPNHYSSSVPTPPRDNTKPSTESIKPYESREANQCGHSPTPSLPQQPPQPDSSVDDQDSESCMTAAAAAAFLGLVDAAQPDLHPRTPCTTYQGTTSGLELGGRDEEAIMASLDLSSFLHPAALDNEFHPTTEPLPFTDNIYDASSTSTLDWYFDESLSSSSSLDIAVWSPPSSAELLAPSLATPTPTDDTNATSDPFNGSSSTASSPCACVTAVINLLLHRSKMRTIKRMVPEQQSAAALCHELEALMQQGLSIQQRCSLCLEDPLVSMIWARITDEYLTTVIASRRDKS